MIAGLFCCSLLYLSLRQADAHSASTKDANYPIVVNTWPFTEATEAAWKALNNKDAQTPALDAIVQVFLGMLNNCR